MFAPSGVITQTFSSPEFADLDGDGKFDLLLGNTSTGKVVYFKNIGTHSNPKFLQDTVVLASIYAPGTTGTNSYYPVPVDMDGDGDFDLVIGGFNGLRFYRNIGTTTSPQWQREDSLFAIANTQIGTDPKPMFGDLDGDGDPDLLVGIGESLFGGPTPGLTFGFRNIGSLSAPEFSLDNSLVAGIPDVGRNSYPCLKDLDNDGDLDLLIGRDLQNLRYYRNTGTALSPVWTETPTVVQGIASSTLWNNPSLCDLDGDGDFDLIYGTSDGTMFYYENIGNVSAPQFQLNQSHFQIIKISGNASTVSLADFDNDGDLDLLSGDWLGRFQYFRNDGTSVAPRFTKTTTNFTSISVGSYSSPVFVDLNGDGLMDIVSGALNGNIFCYLNNGTSFVQNTTIFAGINVGWQSAPAFADLNGDGNLDLLIGAEEIASMKCYRNTGGNLFVLDNSLISGVTSVRNAQPSFVDFDGDGDMDICIGGSNGRLVFYDNTGTPSLPVWTRNDSRVSAISVRQDAAPGFGKLYGSQHPDLIVGEYVGNFTMYRNDAPTSVSGRSYYNPTAFVLHQNYPNPFNPSTTISFTTFFESDITLSVTDILGRQVLPPSTATYLPGTHNVTIDAGQLSAGVYFYSLQSGVRKLVRKMTLVK